MRDDAPAPAPSARETSRRGPGLPVLLLLAVVSGAAALVYEVGWTRRLLLVLGSTSTASAVVLAAFLGGLGLGGRLGGPRADRARSPLALYGVLEVLAAAWALLFPHVLSALEPLHVSLATGASDGTRWALRAVLAVVAVLPGATLLGATYPALLAAAARSGARVGPAAAWIYGVNTLGAVAGALWAGFAGVFDFGVLGSTRLAAGVATAAGLAAVALGRRGSEAGTPSPATAEAPSSAARAPGALLAAAASGFVALGLEAAGTRVLVFFVEGFTASFAAMLATFLAGLAIGSLALGPWLARRARPGLAVGALLALGGLVVLAEARLVDDLEPWMRSVRRWAYVGEDLLTAQRWTALAGAGVAFLPPALVLGAAYPLCVAWATGGDAARAGSAAGRVALSNTAGAVLGPVAVLVLGRAVATGDQAGGPLLAWALLGALATAVGIALLATDASSRRRLPLAGLVPLAGGVLLVPGAFASATPAALVRASHVLRAPAGPEGPRTLLGAAADDVTTASAVGAAAGDRLLYTDDFQAAATGRAYPYMRVLGHLPVLAAANPRRAMVIAFGTGTTAGAVAAHAEVESIEVVEVSRAVTGLAGWFEGANRKVLSDPRVTLRHEDGRNALLLHERNLDVVTLEPLLPTTPAALPFYTREFYELAKSRLVDGGVICQWVPVHAMPLDVYASLLRTFFEAFPDGSLWFYEQSTVLLGRVGTAAPASAELDARIRRVEPLLLEAGMRVRPDGPGGWIAPGKAVLRSIRSQPPGPLADEVVTDERPFPEAHPAPRAPVAYPYLHLTLRWLADVVATEEEFVTDNPEGIGHLINIVDLKPWRTAARDALRGRADEAAADFLLVAGESSARAAPASQLLESAERHFAAAASFGKGDPTVARHAARVARLRLLIAARALVARADTMRASGDVSGAKSALEEAVSVARKAWEIDSPDSVGTGRPGAAEVYGQALAGLGRKEEAADVLAVAAAAWPWATRYRVAGPPQPPRDRRELERLAELLESEAEDVRKAAWSRLLARTPVGSGLAFDPSAPPAERKAALELVRKALSGP
jgi:spermidine synthase